MRELSLAEYKQTALQILIKIDEICREHNIQYMLGYGTLLGAVRHKGFIPWDDDIDIVMLRDEYNRLMNIIESDKDRFGLNFISIENYPDTIYPYGKICDTSTVLYESGYQHVEGLGAFVDVFPWDHIPSNPWIQRMNRNIYHNLLRLIMHSAEKRMPEGLDFNAFKKKVAFIISRPFRTKKMVVWANQVFQKYNNVQTGVVGVPWEKFLPVPADVTKETCFVEFEGHPFVAPARYDEVLRTTYGDYMTLPPVSERVNKHNFVCFKKETSDA